MSQIIKLAYYLIKTVPNGRVAEWLGKCPQDAIQ